MYTPLCSNASFCETRKGDIIARDDSSLFFFQSYLVTGSLETGKVRKKTDFHIFFPNWKHTVAADEV